VLEPDRASAIVSRFCYIDATHRRIISNNNITASTRTNNKGMYLQGIGDSVVGNTITGFRWGMEVHDGASTKIVRNNISGGRIGVLLQTQHADGTADSVIIGGSVADKNTITISDADTGLGGFAISLTHRDKDYAYEDYMSSVPVDARYNDFGVYTESEVQARIFDRADTTLINGHPLDTVLCYPFHGMLVASVKAFLQGPYVDAAGAMTTTLDTAGLVPPAHPYGGNPWKYLGSETVAGIPAGVVDWVLVSLRTGTDSASTVATRAAFIKSDGTIVDTSGSTPVVFSTVDTGHYHIVIHHRNHLAVMSANPMALSSTSTEYDFTTAQASAYSQGADGLKAVGTKFGMFAGNGNGDGTINATDRNAVWRVQNGSINGYYSGDFNLDGNVNATDRNAFWRLNNGTLSQVP
jgi:hypothetical protein